MQIQHQSLAILGILGPGAATDEGTSAITVVILIFLLTLFVAFTIWLLRAGFHEVPEGEVAVVERLGRFVKLAGPGPAWVTPYIEHIKQTVNVRPKEEQYTIRNLWFRDVVQVDVEYTVCYWLDLRRVEPGLLRDIAYRSPEQWRTSVENRAARILRDLISQRELMELLGPNPAFRDDIDRAFVRKLEQVLGEWGVRLDQLGGAWLKDVRLTAELEEALNNIRRTDVDIKTKGAILDMLRQRYPGLTEAMQVSLFNTISGEKAASIPVVPFMVTDFASSQTPRGGTERRADERESGNHMLEGNEDSWRSLRPLPAIDQPDSASSTSDNAEGWDELSD